MLMADGATPSSFASSLFIGIGAGAIILVASALFLLGGKTSSNENNMGGSSSKPSTNKSKEQTKKEAEAEKYPAGNMSIFFGSQTGTAEGFCRVLMKDAKAAGFNADVIDLEEFSPEKLAKTSLAIFIVATYGEGEPTDNATNFINWLKNEDSSTSSNYLNNMKYCVFGLGNSQYEHFNRTGRTTNEFLEKLGANRIFEYAEGDDDVALDEDFEKWKSRVIPALYTQFNPNASSSASAKVEPYPKVELTFQIKALQSNKESVVRTAFKVGKAPSKSVTNSKISASTKHFFTAPSARVLVNRELRNGPIEQVGSTRHIEIDLKGTGLSYETADNLAVLPENLPHVVADLARLQGYELDELVELAPPDDNGNSSDFKQLFPTPCSVKEILQYFFDLQGIMKHSLVSCFVPYINDANQRNWLIDLLKNENRSKFKAFIEEGGVSLVELFGNELSSCKIPLPDLLHILPHMQPRYYTISSSSSCHPSTVHITVSVTEYSLRSGKKFRGLCSGFLQDLAPDAGSCRVFVRPSSFRLPKSLSTPILMIGPGTGIAPMRALLQERQFLQNKQKSSSLNILYFGCKHNNVDFIYRDELMEFKSSGTLRDLHMAFSRDSSQKIYVQTLLSRKEDAVEIIRLLLNEDLHVYVCGATAMGHDVLSALTNNLKLYNDMTLTQAAAHMKELQDKGRYVQELWTA
eukprot:gene6475-8907_t